MSSFTALPIPELFNVKGLIAVVTGGGTGSGPLSASPSATVNPYVPFNGNGAAALLPELGAASSIMFGALIAVAGIFATL